MKRFVFILVTVFLMLSMSPQTHTRIIKEYDSIGELAQGLEERTVYNFPVAEVGVCEEGFTDTKLSFTQAYVDVIVHDEYYGDITIRDDILRYIVHVAQYNHIELFLVLSMIQHDNTQGLNICTESEDSTARRAIFDRVSWAYRVRALGVPNNRIFLKYRSLPRGFFNKK